MKTCPGQLVVHRDGTVAYCTEDTDGRRCAGEDHPHRGGFFACRVVDGESCAYCSVASVTAEPVSMASVTAEPVSVASVTAEPVSVASVTVAPG